MIWLAVLMFCNSPEDCAFAYKETTSPMACENQIAEFLKLAQKHQVPFAQVTCLPIKGVKS